MPGKQKNVSISNESDAKEGKNHLTKCDSTANDSNPAQCGSKYGFQRKFTRNSSHSHFCAVSVVQRKKNNEWSSKERCIPATVSHGNISSGRFWTIWTAREREAFWFDWRVWRGCLSKGGWFWTKNQMLLSRKKIPACVTEYRIGNRSWKLSMQILWHATRKITQWPPKNLEGNVEILALMTTLHNSELKCSIHLDRNLVWRRISVWMKNLLFMLRVNKYLVIYINFKKGRSCCLTNLWTAFSEFGRLKIKTFEKQCTYHRKLLNGVTYSKVLHTISRSLSKHFY